MNKETLYHDTYRVAAVVVTYGSRLSLLKQAVKAILKDGHVKKIIIVDNASEQGKEIRNCFQEDENRVCVIRHDTNLGSAGGFAAGIKKAQEEDVDYVYLSDDDVVISDDFVASFKTAHYVLGDDKSVLCARRKSYWAGTDVHFAPETEKRPRRYFNIFNPRIIFVFLKALLSMQEEHAQRSPKNFYPIIPSFGWAYAGVFLPIQAVRKAPLPDGMLGLYLDDIVYSWGVIDAGYRSFALIEPHLVDLEMTHADSQTAVGLFAPSLSTTKIYYETRNRVRVSLVHGRAQPIRLAVEVTIWCIGVCFLGMIRMGITRSYVNRVKLIIEALRAGFDASRSIPENVLVKI